jgi:hypothetical protein
MMERKKICEDNWKVDRNPVDPDTPASALVAVEATMEAHRESKE